MTALHLDFETKSKVDLFAEGTDKYVNDPSTTVLLAGFALDDDPVSIWDKDDGEPMPSDLKQALRDPEVLIWAFNAQFERQVLWHTLGLADIPYERFRCVMALSYMFSFTGGLAKVGAQIGLPLEKSKLAEGKKLIKMFCGPNKTTKNQPFVWRDRHSDPEDWHKFKYEYLPLDVESEREIKNRLTRYSVPDSEWEIYHVDQIINDRGLPIDRTFVESATGMAAKRRDELISKMNDITGLENSNSATQILPWMQERGYPHTDLQKATISKFLVEEQELVESEEHDAYRRPVFEELELPYKGSTRIERHVSHFVRITPEEQPTITNIGLVSGDALLTGECRTVVRWRQAASKTSSTKYDACLRGLADDDRLRHCFQYGGASRTLRWAGRKIQPQNLPRTPGYLEPDDECNFDRLEYVNTLVREGRYSDLDLFGGEIMNIISGVVRSSIRAPEGKKLVVCDLSSIETVTIGWLAECNRLLDVFRDGLDAYKDFATTMYNVAYDEVTKKMRTNSKPAVLGAGYRLGGGEEFEDGKKSGLWGYAENMGIQMSREEAHRAVSAYRETYREVVETWYAIEEAVVRCLKHQRKVTLGPLVFEVKKPFLRVTLPSGRHMYYHKAQVKKESYISPYDGKRKSKMAISYMGVSQETKQWTRIASHGGKFIENFVQAIARDILAEGMVNCHKAGFYLVGHVHDELIAEQDENDETYVLEFMRELMIQPEEWRKDMPLGAEGYEGQGYRKD